MANAMSSANCPASPLFLRLIIKIVAAYKGYSELLRMVSVIEDLLDN